MHPGELRKDLAYFTFFCAFFAWRFFKGPSCGFPPLLQIKQSVSRNFEHKKFETHFDHRPPPVFLNGCRSSSARMQPMRESPSLLQKWSAVKKMKCAIRMKCFCILVRFFPVTKFFAVHAISLVQNQHHPKVPRLPKSCVS